MAERRRRRLVSIVTRRVTNRFSGGARVLQEPEPSAETDAEDLGAPKPDYNRNQWGSARRTDLKDRIHVYGAIEYQTDNRSFASIQVPQFYGNWKGCFRRLTGGGSISSAATAAHADATSFVRWWRDGEHIDCEPAGHHAAFSGTYVESPARYECRPAHVGLSNRSLTSSRFSTLRGCGTRPTSGNGVLPTPGEFPAERIRRIHTQSTPSRAWVGSRTRAP